MLKGISRWRQSLSTSFRLVGATMRSRHEIHNIERCPGKKGDFVFMNWFSGSFSLHFKHKRVFKFDSVIALYSPPYTTFAVAFFTIFGEAIITPFVADEEERC